MSTISEKRQSITRMPRVQWKVIPHTPALVLVGYYDEEPAALIERGSYQEYRLLSTRGAELGSFDSVGAAQASFERRVRD